MARSFEKKARNTGKRRRTPVIVIAAEGKNVTELQYMMSFNRQHGKYRIHPIKAGHKTDPRGLRLSAETFWRNNEMSEELGDRAFVVMDLDCNTQRAQKAREEIRNADHAEFILSNPCFEIWFLFHFEGSTHAFLDGNEVVRRLRKYIPDYEKSSDGSKKLRPLLDTALRNAEKIRKYHQELHADWPSAGCNPMTDADQMIKVIVTENEL